MDTIHFIMIFILTVGGAGQCHLVTEIGTLNMELTKPYIQQLFE